MSQGKVELLLRAFDAYQRRDDAGLIALCHEDCEAFTFTEGFLVGEPYRGHAGIEEWLEHEFDPWDEFAVEPTEVREVGDSVLLRQGPGVDALVRLRPGADLEQAELLGGERGLLVGVVLLRA